MGATEVASQGYLLVETDPPGASVRINGNRIGNSPARIMAPFGNVSIQVSLDGYATETESYDFRVDGTSVPITLRPLQAVGQVIIVGAVSAELYIDDNFVGTLPTMLSISEGTHVFRAVDPQGVSCTVQERVSFEGGGSPTVNVEC